jgi:hypothetical protein
MVCELLPQPCGRADAGEQRLEVGVLLNCHHTTCFNTRAGVHAGAHTGDLSFYRLDLDAQVGKRIPAEID